MADPVNIFVGKLDFSGLGQGFSEVYYLDASGSGDATAKLGAIITARMPLLSDVIELTYANVSRLGVSRDSYIAIDGIELGSDTVATNQPNRMEDCILVRQETADGKSANRYVHGVPDSVIIGGEYDPTALVGAWETKLQTFLTAVKGNSKYLKKVNPADVTTFTLASYTKVIRRHATTRKVGRPFGQRAGRRRPA